MHTLVIFVGGAADKSSYGLFFGPYYNIKPVFDAVGEKFGGDRCYESIYVGFEEIFGDRRISKNISSHITGSDVNKSDVDIYIVGHSLGGWNGAHLSRILTDMGFHVRMLITIDPAGKGRFVYAVSSIYRKKPEPKADRWINITSTSFSNFYDMVAALGGRWRPRSADVDHITGLSHEDAGGMFTQAIPAAGGRSAFEILINDISEAITKRFEL